MAESLEWVFELFDKVSVPADKMASAIDRLEKRLDELDKQGRKAEKKLEDLDKQAKKAANDGIKNVGKAAEESASKMGNFGASLKSAINVIHDVMHIGQMAFGFLSSVANTALSGISFALQAARFREDTRIALETMLRSKAEARDVMDRAVDLAARTPLSTEQVMDNVKMLIMGGFGKNDALALEEAVSDLGAMKGFDRGAMDSFVGYLVKIKSTGHLTRDALSDMTRSGLMPAGPVLEELSRITGKSMAEVDAAIAGGSIDSITALQAFYNAIGTIGGGEVGKLTKTGSESLSGLLSTLGSRPQEMFMALDQTKGLDSFKGFIKNLGDLFDPKSEFGQRVQVKIVQTFNRAFGGAFDGLSGPDGMKRLEGVFDMALEGLASFVEGISESAGPAFETFMAAIKGDQGAMERFKEDMRGFGLAVSDTFKGLLTVGKAVLGVFDDLAYVIRLVHGDVSPGEFVEKLPAVQIFKKLGDQWEKAKEEHGVPNVDAALDQAWLNLVSPSRGHKAGEEAGIATAGGFKSGWTGPAGMDQHSPSRVMERYGEQMTEGLQLGVSGEEAGVDSAVAYRKQVISQGGALNVGFTINAQNADQADKIRDLVVAALTGAFEQVALETGVS